MTTIDVDIEALPARRVARSEQPASSARFRRIAISSVHGDPLDPRTWSSAPFRIAQALRRRDIEVLGVNTAPLRSTRLRLAARHLLAGMGVPRSSEAIMRGHAARAEAANRLEARLRRDGVKHVLHMGTLDLPLPSGGSCAEHYAYCDQTWALSLKYRPDLSSYSRRALRVFEELERAALYGLAHVFTFGAYVRDHLISHYGLPPSRVTVAGSGMGPIVPHLGVKDYAAPEILFVAKHLFVQKGGKLLLDAFRLARRQRPDLVLTIVGDDRTRDLLPPDRNIRFFGHVQLTRLQALYRNASLLAQPMLNDPWGQVYLEALVSRTPVLGLRRNGLPEITENGRHGFLVDSSEPGAVADAILDALSDPDRLARMGETGQQYVLTRYSWRQVADRIAGVDADTETDEATFDAYLNERNGQEAH